MVVWLSVHLSAVDGVVVVVFCLKLVNLPLVFVCIPPLIDTIGTDRETETETGGKESSPSQESKKGESCYYFTCYAAIGSVVHF